MKADEELSRFLFTINYLVLRESAFVNPVTEAFREYLLTQRFVNGDKMVIMGN